MAILKGIGQKSKSTKVENDVENQKVSRDPAAVSVSGTKKGSRRRTVKICVAVVSCVLLLMTLLLLFFLSKSGRIHDNWPTCGVIYDGVGFFAHCEVEIQSSISCTEGFNLIKNEIKQRRPPICLNDSTCAYEISLDNNATFRASVLNAFDERIELNFDIHNNENHCTIIGSASRYGWTQHAETVYCILYSALEGSNVRQLPGYNITYVCAQNTTCSN